MRLIVCREAEPQCSQISWLVDPLLSCRYPQASQRLISLMLMPVPSSRAGRLTRLTS